VGTVAGVVFVAAASTALADQYFHTVHLDLSPIGSAPLKSGFVNDIHTNGTQNSAQERYQLNDAVPNNTYSVRLNIYNTNSACSGAPDRFRDTATFTTNGSGNGQGDFTFPQTAPWPPPVPPTLRTVYIQWIISDAAGPEYETDCTPVVLGG
jgi:hypothetical protein